MKKWLKTIMLSMTMACLMTITSFANPVTDLRDELLAAGVPSKYVGNIVEHLQKTNISDAQYNQAKSYISQAKAIIGDTKDLSKLPSSDKLSLQNLAVKAGATIGLNVQFGKDASGRTTVTATNKNGATIFAVSTADIQNIITNFNPQLLVNALEAMVEFANNPNKGDFTPIGGELTETATNYGNLMVIGLSMIAAAAGIKSVSKKQFA